MGIAGIFSKLLKIEGLAEVGKELFGDKKVKQAISQNFGILGKIIVANFDPSRPKAARRTAATTKAIEFRKRHHKTIKSQDPQQAIDESSTEIAATVKTVDDATRKSFEASTRELENMGDAITEKLHELNFELEKATREKSDATKAGPWEAVKQGKDKEKDDDDGEGLISKALGVLGGFQAGKWLLKGIKGLGLRGLGLAFLRFSPYILLGYLTELKAEEFEKETPKGTWSDWWGNIKNNPLYQLFGIGKPSGGADADAVGLGVGTAGANIGELCYEADRVIFEAKKEIRFEGKGGGDTEIVWGNGDEVEPIKPKNGTQQTPGWGNWFKRLLPGRAEPTPTDPTGHTSQSVYSNIPYARDGQGTDFGQPGRSAAREKHQKETAWQAFKQTPDYQKMVTEEYSRKYGEPEGQTTGKDRPWGEPGTDVKNAFEDVREGELHAPKLPSGATDRDWQGDYEPLKDWKKRTDYDKIVGGTPIAYKQHPSTMGLPSSTGGLDQPTYEKTFKGTSLESQYDAVTNAAKQHGVNPALLSSVMAQETGRGRNVSKNNPAGLMDPATGMKKKIQFDTLERGIYSSARNIAKNLKDTSTLGQVADKYSPLGARNDPGNRNKDWPGGVQSFYKDLSREPEKQPSQDTARASGEDIPKTQMADQVDRPQERPDLTPPTDEPETKTSAPTQSTQADLPRPRGDDDRGDGDSGPRESFQDMQDAGI